MSKMAKRGEKDVDLRERSKRDASKRAKGQSNRDGEKVPRRAAQAGRDAGRLRTGQRDESEHVSGRDARVKRTESVQKRRVEGEVGDEKSTRNSESRNKAPIHEGRQFDRSERQRRPVGGWGQERGSESGQRVVQERVPDQGRGRVATPQQQSSSWAKRVSQGQQQQGRSVLKSSSILNTHNAGVMRNARKA